jgi:hypothetical protein
MRISLATSKKLISHNSDNNFKKASNRADKITENLTEKVNSIENDVINDLREIDKIIAYFEINHDISIQVVSK